MYLKSIIINNFRKFGTANTEMQFAESGDYQQPVIGKKNGNGSEENIINIAPKTTLVVGKNNSGKTTVIDALDILINKNGNFCSTDFNLSYLKNLLNEYKSNQENIRKNIPYIEFNIKIGLDNENSSDILSKLYQVLKISDYDTKECNIISKYQVVEDALYVESVTKLLRDYSESPLLFDKFKKLIDDTSFNLQYFNNKEVLIDNFKFSNLIELTYIKANNIREEKGLTNAFSKIVEYKYKNEKDQSKKPSLEQEIDNVNTQLSKYMSESHTNTLNETMEKMMDTQKYQILLKSDLTIKSMLSNVIKYYFKEKENEVPENQFGLGYTNLIMIVAEILEYIEKYPLTAYNSQINLIAIEEPETFMHPQMQELFIKNINDMISDLLNRTSKNINSQIIITTHSPHILNSKIHTGGTFNNINYLKEKDGYAKITPLNDVSISSFTKEEIKKIEKLKNGDGKIEENLKERFYQFEFIKKHIKYNISEIFFADALIFVEGVSEYNLLQYYIDQNEKLNKKFISIVLINGTHAKMYDKLIKIIDIPTLIITDIDIKRDPSEKGQKDKDDKDSIGKFVQINSLADRTSTNSTLNEYMKLKPITDLDKYEYYEKDNIKLVFQKDPINNIFATSFEESFILTNESSVNLKKILEKLKPNIYSEIEEDGGINNNSYKWQCKLVDDKTLFANEILYKEMTKNDEQPIFELPNYIVDGLNFLEDKLGD